MTVYRTTWIRPADLKALERNEPLLPSGFESTQELDELRAAAARNFGSLRQAALHHLTGASGTEPNVHGKPVFTFWSRNRGVAIHHGLDSHPGVAGFVLVLFTAEVMAREGVVVALDEGLYEERISDALPDTFAEFREEDEVFVAVPVVEYQWTILEAAQGSNVRN